LWGTCEGMILSPQCVVQELPSLLSVEEINLGSPRLKAFVDLPWHLRRGDRCWTPPLRGDLLGNRLLGLTGILSKRHPYHSHSDVVHFLVSRDGAHVGRVSAAINRRFNEHYGSKIAFFGFFDVENDFEAASVLLDRARLWAKSHGMDTLRGPGEYSNATHERQGVLIEGFEHPPTVELTHNPPYYGALLERYGLTKAKDYHAYLLDIRGPAPQRLSDIANQARDRRDIRTRPLVLKNLLAETRLIRTIYNEAWAHNWGFLPITEEEAAALANSLRMVADPGLIRFAFIDDEPAAVLGALPDPNWALRPRWRWYSDSDLVRLARLLRARRHIPLLRLMFFGIRPGFRRSGVDAVLFEEVKQYAIDRGYQKCEASLLLEDNHLILSPSEFMGARRYKTWRIYEMAL
jgi:GNAT superfamily N-acetyltransferase